MWRATWLLVLWRRSFDTKGLCSDRGSCNSALDCCPKYFYIITVILGAIMRFEKGNEIGSATQFGPEWAGQRCGARTKAGTPCQRPAVKRTGRCARHGGKSTGPRTEEGRARIAAAQTKHGRLTKEKRAEARQRAQLGREIRAELRSIEKELVTVGLLAKGWREMFA